MTNTKTALSQAAHCGRLKSFRMSAALILATLMLLVAAAPVAASAQTYTDLYNFDTSSNPIGTLAQGRDGNLYGTTENGGTYGDCEYERTCGTVFQVKPSGTFRVLYNFDIFHGADPYGGLTLGMDGNFYGTTAYGGSTGKNCSVDDQGCGTIFKITKSGSLTTLYSFPYGGADMFPYAAPIQATDGNFYGTTGVGTAYKIAPSGAFTSLGSLPGQTAAPLLQATDRTFYGTTNSGGTHGVGTIFKVTPKGIVKTVSNFDGAHGASPLYGSLIQGSDGNFYGTGYEGGSYGAGVVFKLTLPKTITVLHNFPDPNYPNDGTSPWSGLVQATDGNFYGVTTYGGAKGGGVIFQITPAGGYSILHSFDSISGLYPTSSPMQHTNGKIYGLAGGWGTREGGVVYSLDMGLGPFVSLVHTSGKAGRSIEVLGQGFTGTTSVSFNGTAATFTVHSDTFLKATVPTGATTGFVTVTTPGGTLTSNKQFIVKP